MLFPSFKQQPSTPHRQDQGIFHRYQAIGLLRLLPGLILLATSPAFAQITPTSEVESISPSDVVPTTFDAAPPVQNSFPELEPDLNITPLPLIEENEAKPPRQTKIDLDSPPTPEIAATLCDGTAQSLAGQIIITSETVCQSGLTPPSLWWTKEQVAQELRTSGKLVNDWSAQLKTEEAPGQVRLVVNPQMWSLMDYFERYDFVSNFGLAAKGFGYQTEIYNTKGTRLASYVCEVQDGSEDLGSSCKMNLGSSLNFGSRVGRKGFL